MSSLKLVTLDNAHELIPQYIVEKSLMIGSYEDMMGVILSMIRDKHFFNMDKNILRGCLEDLTYMYSPGDDVNKDRVEAMLEPSDDEDEDEDDDSESNDDGESMQQFQEMMMKQLSSQMGGMDMGKMMEQMTGGQPEEQRKCDGCPENGCGDCPEKEEDNAEDIATEGSVELTKEETGAE
tara:strand:- start:401 stop:940 length:540 start_codon:yes stop_codon:yes gene_type:complete